MSATRTATQLYRELTAALNSQNLTALDELLTPDFMDHALPPGTPPSIESFKAFRGSVDGSMGTAATVEDLFAEGDRACARITVRATHVGTYMGIPPTGKHLAIEIIEIIRVQGWQDRRALASAPLARPVPTAWRLTNA